MDLYLVTQCKNYQEVIMNYPTTAIQYGRCIEKYFTDL